MPHDLFTYRLPADVAARISAVPAIDPQADPQRPQESPTARAEDAGGC